MVDEFQELLDICQQEGSFERLLARARNRRRVWESEIFCDEATGRSNKTNLFARDTIKPLNL